MRQVIKMCKVFLITECGECPFHRKGVMGNFCKLATEYTPIPRENKKIPETCKLPSVSEIR